MVHKFHIFLNFHYFLVVYDMDPRPAGLVYSSLFLFMLENKLFLVEDE